MEQESYLKNIQDKAFELCLAIYRMIKYFPEREILINQIKGLANELTADVLILGKTEKSASTEIIPQAEKLIVFLRIAGTQGWLNPINFDFLINGYQKLRNDLLVWENIDLKAEKKEWTPVFPPSLKALEGHSAGMTKRRENATKKKTDAGEELRERAVKKISKTAEINSRQKKILDFLNKRKEAKMSDLQGIFKNEVTERTLRNDLQSLVGQKMIRAEGEFKTRRYFMR